MYTCDAEAIQYLEHRRGVDAVAVILKDGKPFATLHDEANSIVARVDFVEPDSREEFLKAAHEAQIDLESDAFTISEYARKIVADAEDDYLANQKQT